MDLEQQEQIREHFEQMYLRGQKPWTQNPADPLLSDFFQLLKKTTPKARVLDIGCGDGWISIAAAKQGFDVWGIDSSSSAIKEAVAKAKAEGVEKKTHSEVSDALDLSFEDKFFDALIDRGLFHHILPENRPLYFRNILRVLRAHALIYLSVFSTKNPVGIGQLFTKKSVEKLFGKHFQIRDFTQDAFPTNSPAHIMHFILERKA